MQMVQVGRVIGLLRLELPHGAHELAVPGVAVKTGQVSQKLGKSVGRPMPGVFEQVTALPPHVTNIGTVAVSLPHVARIAQQADDTIAHLRADLARRAEHDDDAAERTNRLLSGIEEQRDEPGSYHDGYDDAVKELAPECAALRAEVAQARQWAEREKARADGAELIVTARDMALDALGAAYKKLRADYAALYRTRGPHIR